MVVWLEIETWIISKDALKGRMERVGGVGEGRGVGNTEF
jgi:hypothetical protein